MENELTLTEIIPVPDGTPKLYTGRIRVRSADSPGVQFFVHIPGKISITWSGRRTKAAKLEKTETWRNSRIEIRAFHEGNLPMSTMASTATGTVSRHIKEPARKRLPG